jgi:hypothetical protein
MTLVSSEEKGAGNSLLMEKDLRSEGGGGGRMDVLSCSLLSPCPCTSRFWPLVGVSIPLALKQLVWFGGIARQLKSCLHVVKTP